jgi:hypothetical protein
LDFHLGVASSSFIKDVKSLILSDLIDMRELLEHQAPVRRFIFDGPLILTSFYREGYELEIAKYISNKINAYVDSSTPVFDPLQDNDVILPFKSLAPGENFFGKVRELERVKDLERFENQSY